MPYFSVTEERESKEKPFAVLENSCHDNLCNPKKTLNDCVFEKYFTGIISEAGSFQDSSNPHVHL